MSDFKMLACIGYLLRAVQLAVIIPGCAACSNHLSWRPPVGDIYSELCSAVKLHGVSTCLVLVGMMKNLSESLAKQIGLSK